MVHVRTDKHSDITIAENPDRLIVIVRNGKTGFRAANTMSGAVPSAFANAHLMPQVKITSFYRNTRIVKPRRGSFNGNFMSCYRVQDLTKIQPHNPLTPFTLFDIPLFA